MNEEWDMLLLDNVSGSSVFVPFFPVPEAHVGCTCLYTLGALGLMPT